MIAIDRALATAPAALVTAGATELATVIEPAATAYPSTLDSSMFKSKVYGSTAVKKQLWDMQFGKCCFCEKELEVNFATVEHFRPKTTASDDAGVKRTGYWWLGYEFRNFYLCCSNCNTPKNDYFPLSAGAAPLAPKQLPWAAGVAEQQLVVDPGTDDPEQHVGWVFVPGKGPLPIALTDRGRATMKAVRLDVRDELTKLRGRYYQKFVVPVIARYNRARLAGNPTVEAEAVADAQELAKPDSPHSAMSRAMLRSAGIL